MDSVTDQDLSNVTAYLFDNEGARPELELADDHIRVTAVAVSDDEKIPPVKLS